MTLPLIPKVNILGVEIAAVNFKAAAQVLTDHLEAVRGEYVCVSNVYTTIMAHSDSEYRKVQNSAVMCIPDGKPLSVVGQLRGYRAMSRVTGPAMMEYLFSQPQYAHYFYGTTQECLDKMVAELKRRYPDIKITGYQPSVFRPLSESENDALIQQINQAKPDFVWVALGAPRQENFMFLNKGKLDAVMIGVGGAFSIIAGLAKRAPDWMQNWGLEWFFRFIQEPRRLFWRYFVSNSLFLWLILFGKNGLRASK